MGISVGVAWSALGSRIHRLYLLYQHSPIYSSWFCCGPYPCGVCWGTSTASTQIYGQVLVVHWLGFGSFSRCCFSIRCSSHSANLAAWGGCDSGWTAWRKLFLDFRRLGAGWWLWQGWRVSSACLLRSVLLVTDMRTPGGAIPTRTYRLSTFVGLRHPVMHLQLSLTLKVPERLHLFGLYVYYMVHICDFGRLRVKGGIDFLCMGWSLPNRTSVFCNWIAECKSSSP